MGQMKAAGQRLMAPTLGGLIAHRRSRQGEAHPKDRNLPDDDAGRPVGKLLRGERSKEPVKQSYRESLRRKKNISSQQDDQADIIFGGDPDDPRWRDYEDDVDESESERAAAKENARIERDMRGGKSFYGEARPTMMKRTVERRLDPKKRKPLTLGSMVPPKTKGKQ